MELKVLTAPQAAEKLGVSSDLIWQAVRRGEIETLDVPGRVLFTPSALERWLAQRAAGGNVVDMPAAQVVSAAEIADALGMSLRGVTDWIRRGKAHGQIVRGKWCLTWEEARRVATERGFLPQLEELERRRGVARVG